MRRLTTARRKARDLYFIFLNLWQVRKPIESVVLFTWLRLAENIWPIVLNCSVTWHALPPIGVPCQEMAWNQKTRSGEDVVVVAFNIYRRISNLFQFQTSRVPHPAFVEPQRQRVIALEQRIFLRALFSRSKWPTDGLNKPGDRQRRGGVQLLGTVRPSGNHYFLSDLFCLFIFWIFIFKFNFD